jgi:hypothetical protein
MAYLTSVVPSYGGVLVTWFSLSEATTSSWNTLALNLDGTSRSAVIPHLSFPTMGGVAVDSMSLAVTPQCAFGGLVYDVASGCRFLPLDGNGNETGAVVSVAEGMSGCGALGPAPQGFSMLVAPGGSAGMLQLVTVGVDGSFREQASLGGQPAAYERLVLHDETFLLASELENDAGDLVESVELYDARGVQQQPGSVVTTISGSVMRMVQTSTGVLAAFLASDPASPMGLRVWVAPLADDGQPLASPVALQTPGTGGEIYGFSLDASASGDALLSWNELDAQDHYDLYLMALGPDGSPRGQPTALGTYGAVGNVFATTSADGQHALLVLDGEHFDGTGGVLARPMVCAPH